MIYELEHGVLAFVFIFISYYWEGCACLARGGQRATLRSLCSPATLMQEVQSLVEPNLPVHTLFFHQGCETKDSRVLGHRHPRCLESHLREFNVLSSLGRKRGTLHPSCLPVSLRREQQFWGRVLSFLVLFPITSPRLAVQSELRGPASQPKTTVV